MKNHHLRDTITQALQQLIDWKVDFTDTSKLPPILKDVRMDKDDRRLLENALVNMNAYNLLQQAESKNNDVIEKLAERMKYVDKEVAYTIMERIAVMLAGFSEFNRETAMSSEQPKPTVVQPKLIIQSQQFQTEGFCVNCGVPRMLGATFCSTCGTNMQAVCANSAQLNSSSPLPSRQSEIKAHIGDIIHFGAYKWIVIDLKGTQALVITENITEQRAYNNQSADITWEQCTLRKYLNSDFLNKLDSTIIAPATNQNPNNSWYGTAGGSITQDKVFLLSLDELCNSPYFGNSMQKLTQKGNQSYISDESNSKRVAKFDDSLCCWWLRSVGRNSNKVACVDDNGDVNVGGNRVDRVYGGVRPALWLNL